VGDIAANAGFARAGINNVVIRSGHGNRANGGDWLLVKKRLPVRACISALPHAAGSSTKIKHVRLTGNTCYCQYASATEWAHLPPAQRTENFLVSLTRYRRRLRAGCLGCRLLGLSRNCLFGLLVFRCLRWTFRRLRK